MRWQLVCYTTSSNYILNYISCKIPLLANCMPYIFPLAKRPKVERMSHLHTICAVCTYTYCANIPTVAILLLFTSFHNIFVCVVKYVRISTRVRLVNGQLLGCVITGKRARKTCFLPKGVNCPTKQNQSLNLSDASPDFFFQT